MLHEGVVGLRVSEDDKALEFSCGEASVRYYPVKGSYIITLKRHGVFLLEMLVRDGKHFLRCTNNDIEDLLFYIFGLRNKVSVLDVDGTSAVDFDVFGLNLKNKMSKI